ncbi:MAG TPA: phosphatidylserine/phosphatidylglycerophosphate/cardiolipin synthase family protein [Oscillatoriaceae cyanobacterium]
MRPIASKLTVSAPKPRAIAAPKLGTPTTRNRVIFHGSPEASMQALRSAIAGAKRSFYVETFIWHDDAAGNAVIDALAARMAQARAAGEAFDAKVLIDWVGLHDGKQDAAVLAKLRAIGAEVRTFSPRWIDWTNRLIAPITHRKLYIADGARFITGGRNIGDEYLAPTHADQNGRQVPSWRDLLYTVEGTETGPVREGFLQDWVRAGGTRPAQLAPVEPSAGHVRMRAIATNPYTQMEGLLDAHLKAIADAKREILAIYPYFSDTALIDALIDAKRRRPSLKVNVLLPGTQDGSLSGRLYDFVNRGAARKLLAAGIEVRQDGTGTRPFSHLKALALDGRVLSIGSANADERTFEANCELNTLITDRATTQNFLAQIGRPDWDGATPMTLAQLDHEPWWSRVAVRMLTACDRFF